MDAFLRKELRKQDYIPHASSIMQYHRCRRKWGLGQIYTPLTEHKALTFGTAFHEALELHFSKGLGGPPSAVLREYNLEEEEFQLLDHMYNYFVDHWLEAPENSFYKNLKFLETEQEFEVEVNEDVKLAGRIDAIVEDEYGRLWVLDYKTRSMLQGEAAFDTDIQMSIYALAAVRMGYAVEGVIVLQFLKKEPKGLRVLKNGSYSTAKNQRVSPLIVRKQLEGEDPQGYEEFLRYDPDEDPFIRAVQTHRTVQNLERTQQYVVAHHREVALLLDRYISFVPNFTRDCSWDCPFRAVCMAYEDGYDWEDILRGSFVSKVIPLEEVTGSRLYQEMEQGLI